MKRFQVIQLVATCSLVVMTLLCGAAASHAATSPPVTFDLNVPHNSGDHGAHNIVTFALTSYDSQGVATVTISGSYIKDNTKFQVGSVGSTPVNIPGKDGGVGYVSGTLTQQSIGNVKLVIFSGTFNGWYGYQFQSHVTIPSGAPLIVGVTDGK